MERELITSQVDIVFDFYDSGFDENTSLVASSRILLNTATEQAEQFDCAIVSFSPFINSGSPQGDLCTVKYAGTQENLDRLLEEIGHDAETTGMKWVIRYGTYYECVEG